MQSILLELNIKQYMNKLKKKKCESKEIKALISIYLVEENLQKLSPNQPKELDEKIQKSPPKMNIKNS